LAYAACMERTYCILSPEVAFTVEVNFKNLKKKGFLKIRDMHWVMIVLLVVFQEKG